MRAVLTRASAVLDRSVVRLFMERRMASRATLRPSTDARQRLIEVAAAYNDGTLGATSAFFPAPPNPDVTVTTIVPHGAGPLGTGVVDLTFPSDYRPYLPQAREIYARVPENHTAHVRLWTSGSGTAGLGRPTIVMLHGWGGGNPRVTAMTFGINYWLRHGFDVAAFTLPYHGARAPGASGAMFPSPNPLRTNEAFGQAIFDLRALAIALRARGATAVGAFGMSLGGYTTALWASVAGVGDVGGADFAVAMIPAVSFARLIWQHGEHNAARKDAINQGITEDLLAEAFMVHTPTTRAVRLPRERLAVIAGRGNRITPAEHAEQLAEHWNIGIEWFAGGHLAQLGRGDTWRTVRKQLGALALPGQVFRG